MSYLKNAVNLRQTAQSEQAVSTQVKNNAGGYVWKISDMEAVKRFLILGTEGGTYYVSEKTLTKEMAVISLQAIQNQGTEVVDLIVQISDQGRAAKNDTALFLLAAAAAIGNLQTRRAALNALPRVARTATHLFTFLEFTKQFRGWGRALKSAVAKWYNAKEPDALAYQMVKYRSRQGWSHRDVLRKAHPNAASEVHAALYDWACHDKIVDGLPKLVTAFEKAKPTTSPAEAIQLLNEFPSLPWEALHTSVLADTQVWKTLLPNLPLTALIRNLGRMTANGAIKPLSSEEKAVVAKLTNETLIRKARIHPLALFVAKRTYQQGHGDKGSLSWTPSNAIVGALEQAFYLAFKAVEPTGKRFLLALDVSGSMGMGQVSGVNNLNPREASGVLALTTLKVEPYCHVVGFTGGNGMWGSHMSVGRGRDPLSVLPLSASDSIDSTLRKISGLPFGGTDCALPMVYAKEKKLEVDTFVIYTDNETWAGNIHPFQALQQYRKSSGINAKLVVVAMTGTQFSIADPSDRGMLDVVGFDTNTPQAISEFAKI